MDDHHPAIEAEGPIDPVECMDILEEWTNVFRQRKPNVERLIGKRKRDDDIVHVQNDDAIDDRRLCAQHATVLRSLSSQLKSARSTKLPALMYFYSEFLACCMSEVSTHPPLPSVLSVVSEFLRVWNNTNTTNTTAAWFRYIPQAEIWLRLLQVLVQGFVSCQEAALEAVVQSQWLQTIDELVIHLFSVLAAPPPHQSSSISTKGETTFLNGCVSSAKLAASLHLHVLTLLHAMLSPSPTRRTTPAVDVGHYVSLWRQSRTWLPTITEAMLVLAEDDEALIALLLALVQCVPLMMTTTTTTTTTAAIDDSDRQTLFNDCCAAMWTFVSDILLWDEALLVDFFSSEETAALELWIRCLKVLCWSDVQRRWAVHATASAAAAVGTARLNSCERAVTASVVSTALRVTILVDEPPAGDVAAAADGVTGLLPTPLPSLPPLRWIPLNDRTPAIADGDEDNDGDDDGESDTTGVDDLYATLGILVSPGEDTANDDDDDVEDEEDGDGDGDGDGDDNATSMVAFLRRLQATLAKRHRLGLLPFHPRSLSRAIDVFLAS